MLSSTSSPHFALKISVPSLIEMIESTRCDTLARFGAEQNIDGEAMQVLAIIGSHNYKSSPVPRAWEPYSGLSLSLPCLWPCP